MADVQLEKGHVRIANRLDEAIIVAAFNGTQLKLIHALIRLTWGWREHTVRISTPDLAEACGLKESGGFRRDLRDLLSNGVITELEPARGRSPAAYQLNKDYEHWGRFSIAEARLETIYGVRPPTLNGSPRKVTQPSQETNEDSDDGSVTPQGHSTTEEEKSVSGSIEPAIRLGGGTHTPPNSFNGETYNAGKPLQPVVSSKNTDLSCRAAIAPNARENAPSSARFLEAQPERSRGEWRRELATLTMAFGDVLVEQCCGDALIADPPITSPRVFRIFCAQAKRDAVNWAEPPAPIKRPAPTIAADAKRDEDEHAEYDAARREAGTRWRDANPAEFATMLVDAELELGPGLKLPGGARIAELEATKRAAIAGGFPDFDGWRKAAVALPR